MCMRVKSDKPITMTNGELAYIHRLTDAPPTFRRQPRKRKPSDTERHVMLAPFCRRWFVKRGENLTRLAAQLGVTDWALDSIKVGWNEDEKCWTFPELNHLGQIVGVTRRFADGKKLAVLGGGRGLTYADDWADVPGPVLIVEGGSDVAAGLTMGLCVVGRPSNVGGLEYLARLLGRHVNRQIIIVAERDEKDRATLNERHSPTCRCCGQCYPGKHGAIQTSIRLSSKLERIVRWSFMPGAAKDMRGWLNHWVGDPNNVEAAARLGESVARMLLKGVKE